MNALVVSGVLITYNHLVATDAEATHASADPSDAELRRRLEEIEEKKHVVGVALKRLRLRISDMKHEIKKHTFAEERYIFELMQKISDLQDLIRAQTKANAESDPDDLDNEFADFDRDQEYKSQYHNTFDASDEEESDESVESPELKKLFRMIAQRTHPDRTDDPEKHMLFLAAKECRKNNDLTGMREIWALLQSSASAILNKLLKQVEEERQALYDLQAQLDWIKSSMDYQVLQAFDVDQMAVVLVLLSNLEERRQQLSAQLLLLQRLTGTYKPPPRFLSLEFG